MIRSVADGAIRGTFYGSAIQMSEINARWDGVHFAFATLGGTDRCVTMGRLVDGTMEGSTYSPDRPLLQPWTAVRQTDAGGE